MCESRQHPVQKETESKFPSQSQQHICLKGEIVQMLFLPPHSLLQQGLPHYLSQRTTELPSRFSKFGFNECKINKVAGEHNLVNRAAAESTSCWHTAMDSDFLQRIHRSITRPQTETSVVWWGYGWVWTRQVVLSDDSRAVFALGKHTCLLSLLFRCCLWREK